MMDRRAVGMAGAAVRICCTTVTWRPAPRPGPQPFLLTAVLTRGDMASSREWNDGALLGGSDLYLRDP